MGMMYFPVSELKKKSDVELLHLFYQGHENAIAVLFARHKKKICSHIFNYVRSKEVTEDLYQDIIYKALVKLKKNKYTEKGKFFYWLFQLAKNHLIDYHRMNKNKKNVSYITYQDNEETCIFDVLQYDNIEETDFSKKIAQTETSQKNKNIIKQLINQLPAEQKEVIILRMYYDMSFKEIAAYSKVSINTSLGRMRYALMNLEKMIKEQSLDHQLTCG